MADTLPLCGSERDLEGALAAIGLSREQAVNAATICCDRWCGAQRTALYWEDQSGQKGRLSFEELRDQSARLARLLVDLGVGPGDRVAGLLPRTPMLLVVIFATWRAGAVYQPLFTAFGPKAIEHRLTTSQARVVVTDPANRAKLDGIDCDAHVAVTEASDAGQPSDIVLSADLLEKLEPLAPVARRLDDPYLMMFTSGTTGAAKPLLVPIKALAAFAAYMREGIGLLPDERFWNLADPGWAYGLYFAVSGPLALGQSTFFYNGPFSAEQAVRLIQERGITNLAGSPTAYRLLMAADPELFKPIRGQLRAVSSAGEPLNPEVARWFSEHLSVSVRDHYGQTELGMVLCDHHGLDHVRALGAAGVASPGHRLVILDEDDRELPVGVPGLLAIDIARSPMMWFGGYHAHPTPAIAGGYYRTGDTVERNVDGTISFVGRADDVITSSGYRIGPFDVESALLEHPAIIEVAVIGKPDPQRTEIVKAFVVLRDGDEASEALAEALRLHVRVRLSAHAYPREIEFVADLPKTPSGKIQRFLLRNLEIARAAEEASLASG